MNPRRSLATKVYPFIRLQALSFFKHLQHAHWILWRANKGCQAPTIDVERDMDRLPGSKNSSSESLEIDEKEEAERP